MAFYSKKTGRSRKSKSSERSFMKSKDIKTLQIGGTDYKTFHTSKFSRRKPFEIPDHNLIYSAIPGKILKVLVKPGQKIESGDAIVILEAMKMENKIITACSGIIKNIHVKEGETIPNKFLIAELEG
jgi:biotin carboxyl carrier protein